MDKDTWTDDEDDVEDSDVGDSDEEPTISCPNCRRSIYEDSEQCPYCGEYIIEENVTAGRKPWWIILGTLLALYAVYRWLGVP